MQDDILLRRYLLLKSKSCAIEDKECRDILKRCFFRKDNRNIYKEILKRKYIKNTIDIIDAKSR